MVSKKAIADVESIIEQMTLQELIALREGVAERIQTKQAEERDKFVSEMQARAQQLGFDLGEMFGRAPARQRRTSSGTGERASPAAKYRDPVSGETWSGRGRMATWLSHHIAAGKKKEDFLIK